MTHDQEEAVAMADRIVVMKDGLIEQVGTPTEIYSTPQTLFVADFIGEVNQIPATAGPSGAVSFGNATMQSLPHEFAQSRPIFAATRPEDEIPHGDEAHLFFGSDDVVETEENALKVVVGEMEFLGSFWRCRLQHARFGQNQLIADFPINAVRNLSGLAFYTATPRNPAYPQA